MPVRVSNPALRGQEQVQLRVVRERERNPFSVRATEGELRTDLMPPNTVPTHTHRHTRINSYPAHRTVGVAHTDVLKQLPEE